MNCLHTRAVIGASASPSLKQLLGGEIELINLTAKLTVCGDTEIGNVEVLAKVLKRLPLALCNLASRNHFLITNLMLRQFPRPGLDNARELIANAQDANQRIGRPEYGVTLTLEGGVLTVGDSGDGIGDLRQLFVPGLSANERTLYDPAAGKENVTGRFGQGFLSIFYYLLPEREELCQMSPQFTINADGGKLTFFCQVEGVLFEVHVLAAKASGQLVYKHAIAPTANPPRRKLTVHSKRPGGDIKMKFWERQGQIYVDMKHAVKRSLGTLIKITSPYFATHQTELAAHITKVFKSSIFPITLNGNLINQRGHRRLSFAGGEITFTPLSQPSKRGVLNILECGKLIVDFELDTSRPVPNEVSIDFQRLPLSQERSSIDYKDQETKSTLHEAIKAISRTEELCAEEKNALFNAFYPIVGVKKFNLIKEIQICVQGAVEVNAPLSAPAQKKPTLKSFDLHPEYLMPLSLIPEFEDGAVRIYFCDTAEDRPIAYILKDGKKHLFCNQQLWFKESPSLLAYNLYLLTHWLKNREINCPLDVPRLAGLNAVARVPKNETPSLESDFEDIDWKKYAFPNATIPEDNNSKIVHLLTWFPKYLYPHDALLEEGLRGFLLRSRDLPPLCQELFASTDAALNHYLDTRLDDDFPKFEKLSSLHFFNYPHHLHYLCDAFLSGNPCFAHMAAIEHPKFFKLILWLIDSTDNDLKSLHTIIYAVHVWLKERDAEEIDDCLEFILEAFPYHISILQKAKALYLSLREIIALTGSQNKSAISKMLASAQIGKTWNEPTLALLKEIAAKIAHTAACTSFLEKGCHLLHHSFLLALPKNQLVRFLEVLPESFLLAGLTKENYQAILHLSLNENLPCDALACFVEIYCYCVRLHRDIWVRHTTGFLLPLIHSYMDEGSFSSVEALKNVCQALKEFRQDARLLVKQIYELHDVIDLVEREKKVDRKSPFREKIAIYLARAQQRATEGITSTPIATLSLEESFAITDHVMVGVEESEAESSQYFRGLWEKIGLLNGTLRPFIYALTFKEKGCLLSEDFIWPIRWDTSACLLHSDCDMLERYGSLQVAKNRVQAALKQSMQEYFFIKEICKNSIEAKATKICFEVHCDAQKNTILRIKDDGIGMDANGLKTLKIPHASSKCESSDDPNFGWGFYTIFRDFEEVVITTSQDGLAYHRLVLKKTPDGIMRQYCETSGLQFKGTELLLKSQSDPLLSQIKLEAELVSTCRFLSGVEISFQGTPICLSGPSEIVHMETEGEYRLELGKGEEGIYCKQMLIGPLSDEHLSLVPKPLKQLLNDRQLKMRLYLPHTKQVMNRSHLLMDASQQQIIQRLIVKALCNYYRELWCNKEVMQKEQYPFTLLSDDYWYDFRMFTAPPTSKMGQVIALLQGKEREDPLSDNRLNTKLGLVTHAKAVLVQLGLEKQKLFTAELAELVALEHRLQNESTAEQKKGTLQLFQEEFSEPSAFAGLMVHYPLSASGENFMTIRAAFKKHLLENQLLLSDGEYNHAYIQSQQRDMLRGQVQAIAQSVAKNCHKRCKKIIDQMAKEVFDRVIAVQVQSKTALQVDCSWHEAVLQHFFKALALKLGADIEIEFYTDPDGANAYTHSGSQKVFFNRYGHLPKFMGFCSQMQPLPLQEAPFIELIANMAETLAHELVHIEEASGCHTHDRAFREKLAAKLQKLFITPASQASGPIELLCMAIKSCQATLQKEARSQPA